MRTIHHNGHVIQVRSFPVEKVWYDGQLKCSRVSLMGARQSFAVDEDGQSAEYEVEMRPGFITNVVTVRCNGEVIYTDLSDRSRG